MQSIAWESTQGGDCDQVTLSEYGGVADMGCTVLCWGTDILRKLKMALGGLIKSNITLHSADKM